MTVTSGGIPRPTYPSYTTPWDSTLGRGEGSDVHVLEGRLAGATDWVDRAFGRERWLTRQSPCPTFLLHHGTGAGSPLWQSVDGCEVEARG